MEQPFEQNVIAIVWDFDKTLINGYMQDVIFDKYGVDGKEFWKEVENLKQQYERQGIRVNNDSIYLNHFITCVQQGIFPGLNNEELRSLGKELNFFKGLPEFFSTLKREIRNNLELQKFNISVEHYIVSTGFAEMIRGSEIIDFVDGVWGCEFIETPVSSKLSGAKPLLDDATEMMKPVISQIGYAIDNTSKTRAIFEINKGVNIHKDIDVNSKIELANRRVPFENMIYVADGPSDVPSFSLIKQNGGRTFAVYRTGKMQEFIQVDQLRKDNRIDMYGEADYSEGTLTYMWLIEHVNQIAKNIANKKEEAIKKSISKPPGHINE